MNLEEGNVHIKPEFSWSFTLTIVVIITLMFTSCPTGRLNITFQNQTEHEVDLYIDTLYLMTMKPKSVENCKVIHLLPSVLYIKSHSIGELQLSNLIDSVVGDSIVFYHQYRIEYKIDDSIFSEWYFTLHDLLPPKDTIVVIEGKSE